MRHIHALTPGDHFSPGTGSAVATVVDGLCRHTDHRAGVLVARGTYPDRYTSADALEYPLVTAPHGASLRTRGLDVALGAVGLPRPWAGRVYSQVVRDQEAWPPSVIVAHNGPQLIPLVADRHRSVLYAHNDLLDRYSRREAERTLVRAHRIICVSAYTASRLVAKAPQLEGRTRVVHNGVDPVMFAHSEKAPRGDQLTVGLVGRVVPAKGAHVLLEALALLGSTDIEVTIVGSSGFDASAPLSPYERRLRRLARHVPGPVRFVPFQPRWALPALLSRFDVTVVPSIWAEPFGLTVLEGMAASTAVIASDIGGIPEAAGGAACLVTPGDARDLAAALESLADSPTVLAELAERGRGRALSRTWRHAAGDLAEALR